MVGASRRAQVRCMRAFVYHATICGSLCPPRVRHATQVCVRRRACSRHLEEGRADVGSSSLVCARSSAGTRQPLYLLQRHQMVEDNDVGNIPLVRLIRVESGVCKAGCPTEDPVHVHKHKHVHCSRHVTTRTTAAPCRTRPVPGPASRSPRPRAGRWLASSDATELRSRRTSSGLTVIRHTLHVSGTPRIDA